MTRRAVYTIRDCEGWVRYVGSSGLPEGRYASHLNSDTPLGWLMRKEREAGRDMLLRIEEWLPTKEQGFNVEKLYIAGYARISGDRLLNRMRPSGRVEVEIDEEYRCIREGCKHERAKYGQGLCQFHFEEFYRRWLSFPLKYQGEYEQLCIEAGLVLPEEEEPEEVTIETIAEKLQESIKARRRAAKDERLTQLPTKQVS